MRILSSGDVEPPDTSLVRRIQLYAGRRGGHGVEKWKLLTRLWSEETKRRERRQGEGGVETPDTSLVRRNQEWCGDS